MNNHGNNTITLRQHATGYQIEKCALLSVQTQGATLEARNYADVQA